MNLVRAVLSVGEREAVPNLRHDERTEWMKRC